MSIQFSEKLQEKMEFTISQYIGELHEAGIIEKIKEYYEMYRFNLKYDVYIINALFDDTSPRYNKVMMFNQIETNYFNEEDKNELQKYYMDYCTAIRWSTKRREKWLENKNYYISTLSQLISSATKLKYMVIYNISSIF